MFANRLERQKHSCLSNIQDMVVVFKFRQKIWNSSKKIFFQIPQFFLIFLKLVLVFKTFLLKKFNHLDLLRNWIRFCYFLNLFSKLSTFFLIFFIYTFHITPILPQSLNDELCHKFYCRKFEEIFSVIINAITAHQSNAYKIDAKLFQHNIKKSNANKHGRKKECLQHSTTTLQLLANLKLMRIGLSQKSKSQWGLKELMTSMTVLTASQKECLDSKWEEGLFSPKIKKSRKSKKK